VRRLQSGGGGGVDDAEFLADLLDFALGTADGGVAGAMKGIELGRDVVAVNGQVVGDGDELAEECPGGDEKERGEGEDDEYSSDRSGEAKAFKQGHDGRKQKREEDGKAERQKQDFGEIEDGNGKYGDGDEPELRQQTCGG